MRNRNGDGRLAYAARADDAHEASCDQLLRYGSNGFISTDHSHRSRRQLPATHAIIASFGRKPCRTCDGHHKTITATCDVRYVTGTILFPERLPQRSNLNAEIGLIDRHIWPRKRDQLAVADKFASPLGQGDQDVKCASAQRYPLIIPLEHPPGHEQSEWAEGNHVPGRNIATIVHTSIPRFRTCTADNVPIGNSRLGLSFAPYHVFYR